MKVLLLYPINQRYNFIMPLGLAYIGAVLKKAGHKVAAIDTDAYKYSRSEVSSMLKKMDCDVVCTGGLITTYNYERWIVSEIKKYKPHVKVIAGGNLITSAPDIFMKNSLADAGVIGEGEYAVLEILNRWESARPLDDVKGIIFKSDGNIIRTGERGYIENLDEVPFPARELFPAEHYTRIDNVVIKGRRLRAQGLISNRGCPYKCSYCCRAFGNKVRFRSPANVIEELKKLKRDYKIEAFLFNDELFNVSRERVFEMSEALISIDLNLKWNACCRVNGIDKETIRIMKRAGCYQIAYGVESGSPRILKEMRKGLTPELARHAIKTTYEEGVNAAFTFMVGMPGDDAESICETLEFRKSLNNYRHVPAPNLFYTTPYPGSDLYDNLIKEGRIKDEKKYIEELSAQGLAWNFLINMTKLLDEDLIRLKKMNKDEAVLDFYSKNPRKVFRDLVWPFIIKITGIGLIRRIINKARSIIRRKISAGKELIFE